MPRNKMSTGGTILVLVVASVLGACHAQLKEGCKIETLRACGDDFVPYYMGPHLHESGQEFDEGCAKDKTQIPCTLKFIKECTQGLAQAAALVAVKALEETIEATCVIGSEPYKQYQGLIKCMNSVGDKLHKCVKGFHDVLERAVVKGPRRNVIPQTCCVYHATSECLSKALTPCESVGGKAYMLGVIEQMFGETLNLVCGPHKKGSNACRTLPQPPRLGTKDRRVPNFVELTLESSRAIGRKD